MMTNKAFQEMSTHQLDAVLQQELQKENPESEVVLEIIRILEDREADRPVEISRKISDAWKKYKDRTIPQKRNIRKRGWYISAAAVAAVVLLITTVPKAVGASNIFDVLVRFTDSVVQFFAPNDDPGDLQNEYTFQTDNPGLQQLYDEVVRMGVTEPVVPMWLPEGYELAELKVDPMPMNTKVYGKFVKEDKHITISYQIADDITSTQYEKMHGQMEVYEFDGTGHVMMENENSFSAAWAKDGVECFITTSLDNQNLCKIIDSIYRRTPQ